MTDMLKRATAAVLPIINSDQAHIVAAKSARAALLAALDPEDYEQRKAIGCAWWIAEFGTRYGAPTDPMKCDPNGCNGKSHELHKDKQQWEENDDGIRAIIAALRQHAHGATNDR